jgi:hypothetical protein
MDCYSTTTKNILWCDLDTGKVKITKHARFDEGVNDCPFEDIPPNVQHLQRVQEGEKFPPEDEDVSVEKFTAFTNPLSHTTTESLRVPAFNKSPTFGFDLLTDTLAPSSSTEIIHAFGSIIILPNPQR